MSGTEFMIFGGILITAGILGMVVGLVFLEKKKQKIKEEQEQI